MFERYNIKELFIGEVEVSYSEIIPDTEIGGILKMGNIGCSYITVLRQINENVFVDLQNMKTIGTTVETKRAGYSIGEIRPLSSYYLQDGTKKEIFSKRQALKERKLYYEELLRNSSVKNENIIKR